jgi:hypothetical protein
MNEDEIQSLLAERIKEFRKEMNDKKLRMKNNGEGI